MTEQLCSQVLSLPIFPELSEGQQQAVIDTVRQLLMTKAPADLKKFQTNSQEDQLAA